MFEPKLFLNLAEELKDSSRKDNLSESRIRTSIGRSYYSIFLATRYKVEKLISKELEQRRDIHKILIDNLKGSTDTSLAEFGFNLDSLRGYRHQADYRIRTEILPNIAEVSYKLANELFGALRKLPDKELKSLFISI